MIIVSGSSNPVLAQNTAKELDVPAAEVHISKFPNGEKRIWLKTDVSSQVVVIVQSFSEPVDEHIIELCLLADAAREAGAKKVVSVIPWLGYSPQDKVFRPGEPISIQVISKIIKAVGIDQIYTVDLHSSKSLEFFSEQSQELTSLPIFVERLKPEVEPENCVLVSIDKGSRRRTQHMAEALNLPIAKFDKQRDRATGEVQLSHISGEVNGKRAYSFDDFISTGSSQIAACNQLKQMGLKTYTACVTHAVFAGTTTAYRLQDSQIDQVITTDTYAIPPARHFPKLEVLPSHRLFTKQLEMLKNE